MPAPAPDRGNDPARRMPLNLVRGGAVCHVTNNDPQAGAHILKGSWTPAVCMGTPSSNSPLGKSDDRTRWRNPYTYEKEIHHVNRHSVTWAQHRGTKTTKRGMV